MSRSRRLVAGRVIGQRSAARDSPGLRLPGRGLAALHTAEQQTLAAMKEGADVIYQATFFDGEWVGHADFLIKDEGRPSTLGSWAYDVADTKLARHAKVSALVQMCSYGEHIARLQGVPPQTLTVITGDGTEETFPWSEHAPYFRAVRARMLASMASQQSTYPLPVAHCPLCRWEDHCDSRRRNEDHLSLVAGMRRGQIARLEAAGVGTVAELGAASGGQLNSVKAGAGTLARLQTQARLQIESRPLPIPAHQLLDAVQGQGLSLLPPSDPADVFFDMEGDPYLEGGGREYLFGLTEQANGSATFRAWWAHDRNEEKTAFEGFVDYVTELRDKHPGAHIYHYADYERAALVRLAGRHATREEQVNDLLREGALVDLYRVVRQGVLAGTESYSIKKLEPLYGFARGGAVTNAEDSIVEYERWLDEGRDPQVLDGIAAYNRLDCESTLALRDWLLTLRSGALPAVERSPVGDDLIAFLDQVDIVGSQLTMGVPDDPASRSAAQQARWLLAHLLLWHRREDSAAWRDYFEHLRLGDQELIDDATCLGGMTYDLRRSGRPGKAVDPSRICVPAARLRAADRRRTDRPGDKVPGRCPRQPRPGRRQARTVQSDDVYEAAPGRTDPSHPTGDKGAACIASSPRHLGGRQRHRQRRPGAPCRPSTAPTGSAAPDTQRSRQRPASLDR